MAENEFYTDPGGSRYNINMFNADADFMALVKEYRHLVLTELARRFEPEPAEILAQEVFIEFFREPAHLRGRIPLSQRLLVLTLRRSHEYRLENPTSPATGNLREKVMAYFGPEEKLLLECICFEGYSAAIPARVLKCSILRVKIKTFLARLKLRKIISAALDSGNTENSLAAGGTLNYDCQ
ncbi:MAG: hypothetical protein PHV59_11400 [Victivallales bacterium]|nr:hypothetical protein [Victivallales bacterium]